MLKLKQNKNKLGLKEQRNTIKRNETTRVHEFQNNGRKFHQQVGGNGAKTYSQSNMREAKQFWIKILERRGNN